MTDGTSGVRPIHVRLDSEISAEHVARMTDALEGATRWSLDWRSFVATLRYDGPDGVRRVIVANSLDMPARHPRRDDAPQRDADAIRRHALAILRTPPLEPTAWSAAIARLEAFATVAANAMELAHPDRMMFWSTTPWQIARFALSTDLATSEPPQTIASLAPCIVAIGTSQDDSMTETSLGLYPESTVRGPADALEALRAAALLRDPG